MPNIIDETGEFPEYLFSSLDELREFFHSCIDKVLPDIAKGLGIHDAIPLERIRSHGTPAIEQQVAALWSEASRKQGKLLVSVIDSRVTRVSTLITKTFRILHETSRQSSETVAENVTRKSHQADERVASHRGLVFAGLASGALLTVHGAVAASSAFDRESRGKERRSWGRTALYAAEALGGVALTWASFVALQRSGGRSR
jgi:hypothetical protein